ncbi:hypothetical protein EV361DRAFT_934638 [Lentinula raphanica]|uniref:Uncharacterized protein n=1 Tax=Lentinula raphanica TaxID=153919 RepID=A0AA38P1X4_9AGAR|nr:hypothetical protein F5878DRAFT_629675 [Lentinula raphanica]KAJ3966568.1 hypothetical protein EV361DRAFT_934638 [Lentinula raphanica]
MATPTTVLALWQAKDTIVETAAVVVKNFFAPEHVESTVGPVKFECKLAPTFPNKETIDKVSDNTKVMVAAANKRLQSSLPEITKFQDVQGLFNASLQILMSPKGQAEERIKTFTTEDKSFFDFNNSEGPSQASVASIHNWISTELLSDPGILAASGLDSIKTIRGLITISKSNFDLISNKVQDETLVADVGILTYPSEGDETVRLSNIKIYVWIKEVNIGHGTIRQYEVGLRGNYFCQAYEANVEGIANLKPTTVTNAVTEYEKFVSEVHEFVKDRPEA